MQTSDLLAIVAIVVSAIVSIASVFISYLNNKINIRAKRSELAFEKQIEAFREIAEKMGGIRRAMVDTPKPVNEQLNDLFFSTLLQASMDYYSTWQRCRIYLPPELAVSLREYGKKIISYSACRDYSSHDEFLDEINSLEPEIIKAMNKYMGIN